MSHAETRQSARGARRRVQNALRPLPLARKKEVQCLLVLAASSMIVAPGLIELGIAPPVVNITLAGALFAVLGTFAVKEVQDKRERLWTALFWFRVSSAVYCGIGSIVPYIVNARTERYLRSVFYYTDADVLKVLQVFICSIAIVLTTAHFFKEPDRRLERSERVDSSTLLIAAILLLVVGGLLRYGFVLPDIFGTSNAQYPSIFKNLSKAYAAGLFLLMLHGLSTKSVTLLIAASLFLIDFVAGLLAFDKSEMLTSVIFVYLAILYHSFKFRSVFFISVAAILIVMVTQPLVHYGRAEVAALNGENSRDVATVQQRFRILQSYTHGNVLAEEEKNPLLRLSFVNVAGFAIDQYDRGKPVDRFRHLAAIVVPRALWPNKPAVGELGAEAYELIRSRQGASIGTTHFAEAYWSYGWLGLPLVFIPGGIILSLVSRYAITAVRSGRWLRLPATLLGVVMGHRVSGTFVVDIVGGLITFVVVAVAIHFAETLIYRRGRDATPLSRTANRLRRSPPPSASPIAEPPRQDTA
jgi:hypothetical protein